jgi:hypothetical protein
MSSQPGQPNPQLQQAQQMFSSLSQGRKIAIVAAVVGLIFSFFHWYGASASAAGFNVSESINGWHGWGIIAILLYIVSGAVVLMPFNGLSVRKLVPTLPPAVTDATVVMGAGVIAAIAVILFMLTEGSSYSGPGYSQGPSFGAYIGLICAIAIAVGGYLMRSDPESI